MQRWLSLAEIISLHAEIAISARDSSFCAKSVRYNIFTNGAPYMRLFCQQWKNQLGMLARKLQVLPNAWKVSSLSLWSWSHKTSSNLCNHYPWNYKNLAVTSFRHRLKLIAQRLSSANKELNVYILVYISAVPSPRRVFGGLSPPKQSSNLPKIEIWNIINP